MILAIDQSYTGTGACYLTQDGRLQTFLFKTKSSEPWAERIDKIINGLDSILDLSNVDLENPTKVEHIVMESYAYSRALGSSSIFQLGELGGIIKYHFHKKGYKVNTMHIAHPKMFITGNGQANKEAVIKSLEAKYGVVERNDNIADAIAIGMTFKACIEALNGRMPVSPLERVAVVKANMYMLGGGKKKKAKPRKKKG